MSKDVTHEKIERIKSGDKPRVLDLFSGCGGLSLGFVSAGFKIAAAVEIDELAARSHGANLFKDCYADVRERHSKAVDIIATDPDALCNELNLGAVERCIDVVIGGPPCQAFARVGRAKLREVAQHPEAFLQDPRGNLYLRFLHYVRRFKPLAILMENVPDVLNYGGHNVAEEMAELLSDPAFGYSCRYTLLNAVFYGVPEMRERMFFIAYKKELGATINFPPPSHWIQLPQGYVGSRQVALKALNDTGLFSSSSYIEVPKPDCNLLPAVTASQALGDLPRITEHLEGKLRRGARRFNTRIAYPPMDSISDYAKLMRSWKGFESPDGVADHVIRSLPRDYAIFRMMRPGDQYPQAYEHALALFRARLAEEEKRGRFLRPGNKAYEALKKLTVPPYDAGKFPNKWRKMEADKPARTLMAHLGKDGYSHIHYDSSQARTISVREAARLQSFPDGFEFAGTMNPAFRQIGNAVPPIFAKALAQEMLKALRR